MKRRSFLKSTVVASAAMSTGIISINTAFATAHDGDITKAKSVDEVLKMLGATGATESTDIKIKAPKVAKDGDVVPVGITSNIEGTTEIISITAANPTPFAAKYTFGEGAVPAVKSLFKMDKMTDVIVVVKAGDKFYTAKTNVKIAKGGCRG